MYRIQTDGYDNKQKIVIANNYLLPKIREQVKFNKEDIVLSNEKKSFKLKNGLQQTINFY